MHHAEVIQQETAGEASLRPCPPSWTALLCQRELTLTTALGRGLRELSAPFSRQRRCPHRSLIPTQHCFPSESLPEPAVSSDKTLCLSPPWGNLGDK